MDENQENENEQVNEDVKNEATENEVTEQDNVNAQNETAENDATQVDDNTVNLNYSAEDLKKETKQTVEQVKETIKNTDLKKDVKAAKGFFSSFFKSPLSEIEKCASDKKSSFLKVAIIILLIWLVAIFISDTVSMSSRYLFGAYGSFSYFFKNLFSNIMIIIKGLIAPIIGIAVLSALSYGFSKNKNKSFIGTASTIVISYIPTVIASIVNLLVIFGSEITKITSHFSAFCNVLSTVLLYFAIKSLSGESEDKSYFWKFALIIGIFYVVKFVFSYLGIYL